MGWFTDLFSKQSIMDTASKAAVNGIDMLVFTEEEKSITNQKLLDWKLDYQKATLPQNMSRRYIAVVVTGLWALLVLLTVGLKIFGLHTPAQFVFDALVEIVMPPFTVIIAFYFLAHITGKFTKGT